MGIKAKSKKLTKKTANFERAAFKTALFFALGHQLGSNQRSEDNKVNECMKRAGVLSNPAATLLAPLARLAHLRSTSRSWFLHLISISEVLLLFPFDFSAHIYNQAVLTKVFELQTEWTWRSHLLFELSSKILIFNKLMKCYISYISKRVVCEGSQWSRPRPDQLDSLWSWRSLKVLYNHCVLVLTWINNFHNQRS